MFRLVFTRMMVLYITIIIIIMLGQTFLLSRIYQYEYREQQHRAIASETEELATLASTSMVNSFFSFGSSNDIVQMVLIRAIVFAADRYDATVRLVLPSGEYTEVSLNENADGTSDLNNPVILRDTFSTQETDRYLTPILQGETFFEEELATKKSPHSTMTVGYPIVINDKILAGLFITSKLEYMSEVMKRIYQQISMSSIVALGCGMLLVYWASFQLTRPIKEMGKASQEIAKGNFDRRVAVTSNDEIGELAESFNKMADELKNQESLRKDFVANVSHELRSPLASIQGFAQGMLDGTIPTDDRDKYLNIIVDETRRLNKLIKELLDLSQIESGKFPLNKQNYDINEHIRLAIIRFEERLEAKNINIEVDFQPDRSLVYADPDRIDQVVINLIDNAVKFTPENGTISIWSHAAADRVLVGVKDTGPGIPLEDQPYIWERFYKVDKSHSGRQGTGLGLSIVYKIINQHGERITVKSEPGNGCAFIFSLQKGSAPK